jgi:hypothetical protein
MNREFTYHWLHIPTGETSTRTASFFSRLAFLEYLVDMNGRAHGIWQYWE